MIPTNLTWPCKDTHKFALYIENEFIDIKAPIEHIEIDRASSFMIVKISISYKEI